MTEETLHKMYHSVCDAPRGNGFRVEHMPELFSASTINDCQAHVHSFYEILWFEEGHGYHFVDFQDYEVEPGTIFFLSPGQVHHFDKTTGYKGVAIKMCTDLMKDSMVNSTGINDLILKYNSFHSLEAQPYCKIDSQTAQILKPLVEEMEQEAQCYGEFGNINILKSLLCIFLAKTMRYGRRKDSLRLNTLKPSHQLYIQFRQMIENQFTQLHTVQEYADLLNTAIRTLHKSVNECSNKTPLVLINERIMLEAKRMIRYSDMMIKEIAAYLGYEDTSYFVKLFKRHTGHLPSEFREFGV